MENNAKQIGQTVATLVQFIGTATACVLLIGWAWSLAAGSVLGFVLLLLLGMLFVVPLLIWGLPAVSLLVGLLVQVVAALISGRRSRV